MSKLFTLLISEELFSHQAFEVYCLLYEFFSVWYVFGMKEEGKYLILLFFGKIFFNMQNY